MILKYVAPRRIRRAASPPRTAAMTPAAPVAGRVADLALNAGERRRASSVAFYLPFIVPCNELSDGKKPPTLRPMAKLTHFNDKGDARMVDVGAKDSTHRVAVAAGSIRMSERTIAQVTAGDHKKGNVLGVARVAGILAAKKTAELVPLCHPLSLSHVELDLQPDPETACIHCQARVETRGPTGVEMEALTAVQVALLTIYDMCKAVDRGMVIESVRLLEKSGGKSGRWTRDPE